jgi:hypothetical protein
MKIRLELFRGSASLSFTATQEPFRYNRARATGTTQSLLQLGTIGSADPRPRSTLQNRFELPVRDGLELQDSFAIDDGRPMDANEAHRVRLSASSCSAAR